MTPLNVSDFNIWGPDGPSKALTPKYIVHEYNQLDALFNQNTVHENLRFDQIYVDRNRYSDILTYGKTRVKLLAGANKNTKMDSDYINACYVNSPFLKPDAEKDSQVKGDRKIIAS